MKSYVDEEGRWNHRLHQSWLNEWSLCPERARLDAVGEMPDIETDAASAGTAVHEAIEISIGCGGLHFDGMVDLAFDKFAELAALPNFEWKKYNDEQVGKFIRKCLGQWYEEFGYNPEQWGEAEVEKEFCLTIHEDEHRLIELAGKADVLTSSRVIDWKTTGGRPFQPWEYRRWAVQPSAYCWALERTQFEYVVMGAKEIQRFTVERTHEDFSWLKAQVFDAACSIEEERAHWQRIDTHALCSPAWCPAWSQCKGMYLGPDKPENW